MRPLNDLFKIIQQHKKEFGTGLCSWVLNLFQNGTITYSEWLFIKGYIKMNPPNKKYNNLYYWKQGLLAPRLRWLNRHIKKLETTSDNIM